VVTVRRLRASYAYCVWLPVAVGHRYLVARVVASIAEVALGARDGRQVAGRIVGVASNVTERVGLAGLAAGVVVGVAGGGGVRRAVRLRDRDLPAGKVVLVLGGGPPSPDAGGVRESNTHCTIILQCEIQAQDSDCFLWDCFADR
jgi:hypothetical protein